MKASRVLKCNGAKRNKISIQDAYKLASNHNGYCLSSCYINIKSKLIWKCGEGHIWEASFDNVKYGKWCPICAKELRKNSENKIKNRIFRLAEAKKIIKTNGGKCFIDKIEFCNDQFLVECNLGHQWLTNCKQIRNGNWCPICKVNVQEYIIRAILEYLLDVKVIKYKPKDLININGNRMEFDFWNKDINFAGEHHGRHHFMINKFSNSEEQLDIRKRNDDIKRKYCEKNNIRYFESVDLNFFDFKITDIKAVTKYVKSLLLKNNIKFKKGCPDIDLKNFYNSNHRLNEMRKIAEGKNGKCLSDKYISNSTKLDFECEKGHVWQVDYSHLKRGDWCPYCSNRRRTIDDMKELASKYFGFCLSDKYLGYKTKLKWECKNGHVWMATPFRINCGIWCLECKRNSTIQPTKKQ